MLLEERKKLQLRPYQEKAIDMARNVIAKGATPILVAPTGAGKSAIAINIAKMCISKGYKVLIIAPLEPLISQFYKTCCDWLDFNDLERVGIMAGSRAVRPLFASEDRGIAKEAVLRRCNLVIAMAQTIESRKDLPFTPNLVIWDEAHLSYFREECKKIVMGRSPHGQHIPLTATPWRMDGQVFGDDHELVQVCTTRFLIENGYLTPYRVFNLCNFVIKDKGKDKDYTVKQLQEIVDVATPAKVWEEWQPYRHKHTIAFVPDKKTGMKYVEYFREQGQECEMITDQTPSKERSEIYSRFREGNLVLFSITVLAVGFDEPCATVALILRATKSLALLIQMIGRVLRLYLDKEMSYILDFTGTVTELPLPADIEDWNDIPTTKGKVCPHCGAINASTAEFCKECGEKLPKLAKERKEVTEETVMQMTIDEVFEALEERFNEISDSRKMLEIRVTTSGTPEMVYKALRQKAFLANHSPGKAFFDYKKRYDDTPKKEWSYGSVFSGNGSFEDMCLYFGYLLANKKNKPSKWLRSEMIAEFGEVEVNKHFNKINCIFTSAYNNSFK